MWEDMQHSKEHLQKKASLGVVTLNRIFCCFIDSLTQLSKLLHFTVLELEIYAENLGCYTVHAYSSSLPG